MSYYDPLLEELARLDQPNQLMQAGQQMMVRGAPIYAGGGFWQNLAAQVVPGLLGAGISYLGTSQQRAAEDDLLTAANAKTPQEMADLLVATGRKGLAAKVLFAAQEQEALARAEQAKLQQKVDYESWKMGEEFKGKQILEAMKGARIGANSAANRANALEVARITSGAEVEKLNRQAELQFIDKGANLPGVKLVNETAPYVQSLENIAKAGEERGYVTGAEAITAWNQAGRASSPEALNNFNVYQMMRAEGFQGEIDQFVGWAANQGRISPTIIRALAEAAKQTQKGREYEADQQIATLAGQYGTITKVPERFEAIKPKYSKIAKEVAKALEGPQPVAIPKPVTALPSVVGRKDGDTWTEGGFQYRLVGKLIQKKAIK